MNRKIFKSAFDFLQEVAWIAMFNALAWSIWEHNAWFLTHGFIPSFVALSVIRSIECIVRDFRNKKKLTIKDGTCTCSCWHCVQNLHDTCLNRCNKIVRFMK